MSKIVLSQNDINDGIAISSFDEIIFDDTVAVIPYRFLALKPVKSIFIGKNVQYIGAEQITGCTSLEKITVDKDNKIFDSRNDSNCIMHTKLNKLFFGCKNTIIPEECVEIGTNAFQSIPLREIVIPENVEKICSNAFFNTRLQSIVIPDKVRKIEPYVFACSSIKEIFLPDALKRIESFAFFDSKIEKFICPNELKFIGEGAFYKSKLKSVNFNEKLISIGDLAFCDTQLNNEKIVFHGKLSHIGKCAFKNAIPKNEKPTTIYFNTKNLHTIETMCFRNNNNITSVFLPDNVYTIKREAFRGCNNLEHVKLNDKVIFSKNAFTFTPFLEKQCKSGKFIFNNALIHMQSVSEVLKLDDNIKYIMDNAFSSTNYNLKQVSGENVEYIGHSAFEGCHNLTSIIFPNVKVIENQAFGRSQKIIHIVVSNNMDYIGSCAFIGLNLKDLEIPRIKLIKSKAFYRSNIENLRIDNVQKMEPFAFALCKINNLYLKFFNNLPRCIADRENDIKAIYINDMENGFVFPHKNCKAFFEFYKDIIHNSFDLEELILNGKNLKEINTIYKNNKIEQNR